MSKRRKQAGLRAFWWVVAGTLPFWGVAAWLHNASPLHRPRSEVAPIVQRSPPAYTIRRCNQIMTTLQMTPAKCPPSARKLRVPRFPFNGLLGDFPTRGQLMPPDLVGMRPAGLTGGS